MNYEETLTYLYEKLPMFQRVGPAAIKKDLTNTIKLLNALGNPHRNFKSVHIAGTNGKGTSAHAMAAILQSAGYKTGLYTSPHLKSFTERIKVNGVEVEQEFVSSFVVDNKDLIESINPSFFETTVAMAFEYFDEKGVDVAIIETGLGGRLDSTNVLDPVLSLITMIGWDHADMLGDTLEKIAFEKAGIIKANRPVVIGADQPELLPVFQKKADEQSARLIQGKAYSAVVTEKSAEYQVVDVKNKDITSYSNLRTDITADYFVKNIPGILLACEELVNQRWSISPEAIYEGFSHIKSLTGLKGRWQVINKTPLTVADCSHNAPGLASLFDQVKLMEFERVHLVFGVVRDKDVASLLALFPDNITFYFTQSSVPRSMKAVDLQKLIAETGKKGDTFENVNDAIKEAQKNAGKKDLVLICGSTFVVAEIDEL